MKAGNHLQQLGITRILCPILLSSFQIGCIQSIQRKATKMTHELEKPHNMRLKEVQAIQFINEKTEVT